MEQIQNQQESDKPKEKSMIEEAHELAESLKKIKEELREENDRWERNKANELLAGKTNAGQTIQEKEESPKEYLERLYKN